MSQAVTTARRYGGWTSEPNDESLVAAKRDAVSHSLSVPVGSGGHQHFSTDGWLEAENLGLAGQVECYEQRGIIEFAEVDQQILVNKARPIGTN